MLEQALEARIVAAISTALQGATAPVVVTGFWQPTAPGVLKGMEDDPSIVACVEIMTPLAQQATFSNPVVTFPVEVHLTVRIDLDPTRNALPSLANAVQGVFREWMAATYQQTFTALDGEGLSIDGVSMDGGTPTIDTSAMVARVRWGVTLSGSYQPTTTTTPTTTQTT